MGLKKRHLRLIDVFDFSKRQLNRKIQSNDLTVVNIKTTDSVLIHFRLFSPCSNAVKEETRDINHLSLIYICNS